MLTRMPPPLRLFCILSSLAVLAACQSGPPREQGALLKPDLIELGAFDPALRLDIRYATTNNFMHRAMYSQARAFMQRPAAEALAAAHRDLRAKGYGIVVFDAYRPWSVTKAFWEGVTDREREIEFVANPHKGSKHNRGCAVDLSLIDLRTGAQVEMPSAYDEFTDRAYPDYAGGTDESRALRELLQRTMEAHGFTVSRIEWWHYDYRDWPRYPILDAPFEKL